MSKKITLKEFAEKYNTVKSRRGHTMTESYLYRLIRQDIAGKATRSIWFSYELEGPKERIYIIL